MEKKLRDSLADLHTKLDSTDPVDEETRETLLKLQADIMMLLNREKLDKKEEEDDSLIEDLKRSATRFEGTHPELANSMHIVIHTLSNMGI